MKYLPRLALVTLLLSSSVASAQTEPGSKGDDFPPPYTPECQARLDGYFLVADAFFSDFNLTCPINEAYFTSGTDVANSGVPGSDEFSLNVENQKKARKISNLSSRVSKLRRENRNLKRKLSGKECR
jgi:hypothetical protein